MKYVSHQDAAIKGIRDAVIRKAYGVGFAGLRVTVQRTRVKTGNARRSAHVVVLDEGGSVVGGGGADENGRQVPSYQGNGKIQIVVGFNCNYSIHLERLDGMLAAGLVEMSAAAKERFKGIG